MKQVRISELMDEYTDTEFFPTGGSSADPEAVKRWVRANVKATTPAKKKMPKKKKVLLAAALAAVLVVLAGAGFPYIQYRLTGGELSFEQTADGKRTSFEGSGDVADVEDGRLVFTPSNGQKVDITDLVSEDTPYIYDGSDPDAGTVNYVIIGGTPECFGWLEWVQTPYPFNDGQAVNFDENGNPVNIAYQFTLINYPEEFRSGSGGYDVVPWDETMNHPWLLAGAEELGITFDYEEHNGIVIVENGGILEG